MSDWAPKRFWTRTEVTEEPEGYGIALDERKVQTPAKVALILPSRALAEVVAAEWDAQTDKVDPRTMPATRGANAAIDKVRHQHGEVAAMLADYGDSDLLCYRAASPAELVARQAAAWDPMLDWLDAEFGARLRPTVGVMHVAQDKAALERLWSVVQGMSAFELAGFHDLVSISGSLVLGLAATRNVAPIDELWRLSRVDEIWQAEQWGADEDAEATAALKAEAFRDAKRFYDKARPDQDVTAHD